LIDCKRRLLRVPIALAMAGAAARAAQDEPAAPAEASRLLDANLVIAAVNGEVVTLRDVEVDWRLDHRLRADPDGAAHPNDEQRRAIAKSLVEEHLWLGHARGFQLYSTYVTPETIDVEAKRMFGALFDDAGVPADERARMRHKGEVRVALQICLENDPTFQRCRDARPGEVRRYYDLHPELHRVGTRVTLGKVTLGREVHGQRVEDLAQELRQRAIEHSSLEQAARELARGGFTTPAPYDVENEKDLREEVLEFARTALPGELSPAIGGAASVMLFTVLAREEGRDVTYEECAPLIKERIQDSRCNGRMRVYFVTRVLPEAFYRPPELFDPEIEQLMPGYRARRAGAAASPPAGTGG
jgi:hypothetical protein